MPKVSIVLPTYNGEKFIRESIDSILGQTFTDWELIIVNDCSTDGTPDIVNRYAALDSRIRVINNKENQKLPESLNIGFREARGEYLTWTSDDNMYLPSALEIMAAYLDEHPNEVMVCAWMDVIHENGDYCSEWMKYDEEFMFFNDCVGACFMYKHCVLREIGGYDISFFLVEDYEYWMRILTHYRHIGWIDEKLYLYRVHSGSLTEKRKKDVRKQLLRLRKKYLDKIIEYYRDNLSYLTRVYVDFLRDKEDGYKDLDDCFFEVCPDLKKLKRLQDERNIMAYGAGDFGNRAADLTKDRLELYIDQNADKMGFQKNGRKIITLDQISQYKDKNVLIAMSDEKISDALRNLLVYGIDKVYVCDWDE